jgi:hypothetical protein
MDMRSIARLPLACEHVACVHRRRDVRAINRDLDGIAGIDE